MRKSISVVGGLVCAIGLSTCSQSQTVSHEDVATVDDGRLELSMRLGEVGMLSRAADMSPSRLLLQFSSDQGATLRDTIQLSGSGNVSKSYSMASEQNWLMVATGLDQRDSVLYAGRDTFVVHPNQTTAVSLSMDARYSSMLARFAVADSMTRFVLTVDGAVWGDSSVVRQARVGDTVKMRHDYLAASSGGTTHAFAVKIYGRLWGIDTLMYSLDTSVSVVSGASRGQSLKLHWVGPKSPPPGSASMSVVVGTVGMLTITAMYPDTVTDFGVPWNGGVGFGTLLDSRDGRSYRTVLIGNQTWMAENLKFRNRTGSFDTIGTCYAFNADTCQKYGRLYSWAEATASPAGAPASQGVCPSGWHLPSSAEWSSLVAFAESDARVGSRQAGYALKSTTGWASNHGLDVFGFRALPAGRREAAGAFSNKGTLGNWWSSTTSGGANVWLSVMSIGNGSVDGVDMGSDVKTNGFSVRCLKN